MVLCVEVEGRAGSACSLRPGKCPKKLCRPVFSLMSWNTRPRDLRNLSRGTQWATDRWGPHDGSSDFVFIVQGSCHYSTWSVFWDISAFWGIPVIEHPPVSVLVSCSPQLLPPGLQTEFCPLSGCWPSQPFLSTTVGEAFLRWCGYRCRLVTMQTSSHCFVYMWSISVSFAFWHCHVLCSHEQSWLRLSYQKGFSLRSFPFRCCRAMR